VQERVIQANGSLRAALALAPQEPGPAVELARVALRSGRTDEAYEWLENARRLAPDASVIPYLRATAASDVWRYPEAVEPLLSAHARARSNIRATEMLANVLGIAGRHDEALTVITEGLAVDPERAQLHNLQAIELDALRAPAEAEIARTAYLRYRAPDEAPGLRSRCKRNVPGCARETEPVHEHALHPVR
jgi:tetratricopeptide (TPR) repeat protein